MFKFLQLFLIAAVLFITMPANATPDYVKLSYGEGEVANIIDHSTITLTGKKNLFKNVHAKVAISRDDCCNVTDDTVFVGAGVNYRGLEVTLMANEDDVYLDGLVETKPVSNVYFLAGARVSHNLDSDLTATEVTAGVGYVSRLGKTAVKYSQGEYAGHNSKDTYSIEHSILF